MIMKFKATNNPNTSGEQWKQKYLSKTPSKRKKWLTKHYMEIRGTRTQMFYLRRDNSDLYYKLTKIEGTYEMLMKALQDACGYLEALRGDKGTVWKNTWNELATAWNQAICIKRFFNKSITERQMYRAFRKELKL